MILRRVVASVLVVAVTAAACGEEEPPPVFAEDVVVPVLDRSIAEVPLDTIVFDTFDGGSVALPDADQATIDRLLDAIRPIDAPRYEAASAATWLTDDDLVLGYLDEEGRPWAYPVKILDLHEIVNDELAGIPVLISWCPLCASGVVYDRRVGDTTFTFSNTSALHENDMVMVDRETGSYWWQAAGRAVVGASTGTEMTVLVSRTARWGEWRDRHPDTEVLERPGDQNYERDRFAGYRDRVAEGDTPFPVRAEVFADDRLSPAAVVVAVEFDGVTWAWPVDPPGSVTADVAGRRLTVVTDGVGGEILDEDGDPVPVRTLLWFSLVSIDPDVRLSDAPVGAP